MIWVQRLDGSRLVVNAELITTVEATPDSIITLLNGVKITVRESVDEIVDRALTYRRRMGLKVLSGGERTRGAGLAVAPLHDDE